MSNPVLIPLLNPNEPEAFLAAVHVKEGQQVSPGDLLCTLETTKSTADLAAEGAGYIAGLRFHQGQSAPAGEIFCYLADSPDWQPAEPVLSPQAGRDEVQLPAGLRITQPALALARRHNLDLNELPTGPLVTENVIQSFINKPAGAPAYTLPQMAFSPTAMIIYGGGGHGKSVIDLLRVLGTYQPAGIIDDGIPVGKTILGVQVLGGSATLSQLHAQGLRLAINAVGGIGNIAVRIKIFHLLAEAGFVCPALAHPASYIEPSAVIEAGVQVFPHAYVGSEARIGYGTILNTGSIISHDCQIGCYTNISPGAILAGEVVVGEGVLIGMGVTVNLGVRIGAGARLGNGATVKRDVPDGGVVRAGTIWPAD